MKKSFGFSKVAVAAAFFLTMGFANAQTVAEGINDIDSYKFSKAKEVYSSLVASQPTDANYFYLGNTYLQQAEPNFTKAAEYFTKGVALDAKKSFFSRIGLASIKLGKGDKASAESDLAAVAKDSKEKDPEILYRIGEALTIHDNHNNPALAIQYLKSAIDKAQEKGNVPVYYYYTLGDANRLNKTYGDAMNAYDRATEASTGNKAPVYTRIGTLWMSAKQWQQAKDNLDKAIAADASYAPAYKALGNFYILYQQYPQAAQNYQKYMSLADTDPNTILDYAKLAFLSKDYTAAENSLNSVFDKIDDPIKYRIKAYLLYNKKDYAGAKQSLDSFMSKAETSRILPSDSGLMGLILFAQGKDAKDTALQDQGLQKVAVAKAAKDETMKWDEEISNLKGGLGTLNLNADAGPTNAAIEDLKKQLAANANDTDILFKLANAYQDAQNWNGAASSWQKMAALLPTWEPAYYSLGFALQKGGNAEAAVDAYQKYADVLLAKPVADQEKNKQTLSNAYYNIAHLLSKKDKAKALEYVNKAVTADASNTDAVKLQSVLSK